MFDVVAFVHRRPPAKIINALFLDTRLMAVMGVKQTSDIALHMSAYDPKRTWACAPQMSAFGPSCRLSPSRRFGASALFKFHDLCVGVFAVRTLESA